MAAGTHKHAVAVVEDEPALRDNYIAALRRQGYAARGYGDRPEALAAFERELPDLVIIDINLGAEVEGGFELCRALRARSAGLPIIFLTARDSEIDAVSGLRLGADDYLHKTIGIEHLLARVAALFRRAAALRTDHPARSMLTQGELEIDADRYHVRWKGRTIPLTLTEFWIVHCLARHPGHVRSRAQLMAAANTVLDEASVTSQIKRIRQKFTAEDRDFDGIGTVYGMGYRWGPTP
jgi:two-component system OmpR family response regulator